MKLDFIPDRLKKTEKEENRDPENAVIPALDVIETEKQRLAHRKKFNDTVKSTFAILVVVAAVAVLIATLFMPVLQVSGESMEPTLYDGDMILLQKSNSFETGELIGLYHNGKVLLKRVIGGAGDWIEIDDDGTVYVNNVEIEEPYIDEKALGECDIRFPYQVPDGSWFVMGDHRAVSIDSRSSAIGSISQEDVIGKVVLRFWPLKRFSLVH